MTSVRVQNGPWRGRVAKSVLRPDSAAIALWSWPRAWRADEVEMIGALVDQLLANQMPHPTIKIGRSARSG